MFPGSADNPKSICKKPYAVNSCSDSVFSVTRSDFDYAFSWQLQQGAGVVVENFAFRPGVQLRAGDAGERNAKVADRRV